MSVAETIKTVNVGQIVLLAGVAIVVYLLLRRRLAHSPSVPRLQEKYELPQAPAPAKPTAQNRGVSLRLVPSKNEDADVDIIAIHGLDTTSETWVWNTEVCKDPDLCNNPNYPKEPKLVNWLEHREMLPAVVGSARIFMCDWPADLFERSDSKQKTIEEFARTLLDGIKRRPWATNNPAKKDRPILFIASCLGGIILMQALVMASDEYLPIRRATRGIVFLATPFLGTSFQDVAMWAEPGMKAWASIRSQKVTRLLDSVKGPTFDLSELVRQFTQLCLANPYRVITFYEKRDTILYHKIPLARLIPPCLLARCANPLVNELSATLQIVPHPLPLDRPHVLMNKFWGSKDPQYEPVAGKIRDFLDYIRKKPLLEEADDRIRKEVYTEDRLKIERLSGEELSMDQCYINLAIVEHRDDARSKENPEDDKGDAAPKTSPFSLPARLKTESPDKTLQVKLPTLFDPRKGPGSQTIKPRRILIRGRAGVGKTTLCKKIIHDFTHRQMWNSSFDRVLWVPLRNLKLEERRQVSGYNFGDLFWDEYFSQDSEGKSFAKGLWDEVEHSKGSRTLFILDGLDEVVGDMKVGSGMFRFLWDTLLTQPNIIITSRPHAKLLAGVNPPDLELETIGFYPEQVTEYLENTFRNQQGKVAGIQSLLQERPLMQTLFRIPIQLDALCLVWDEDFQANSIPETMTAIYKAIEQRLWKKDILRLEKTRGGQLVPELQYEIEDIVDAETKLLGAFGFIGLYSDVIDFKPQHQNGIVKLFKAATQNLLLGNTLPRLSFLRTSDPAEIPKSSSNRSYHFLHLTFQEYFAARYFVRCWKGGKEDKEEKEEMERKMEKLQCLNLSSGKAQPMDPVDFLQKHKYSARYDIFWCFVAGLLSEEGEDEIARFFREIEEEPLDLLGPVHQRLVMHCLSEVDSKSLSGQLRIELEQQLEWWLKFECNFNKSAWLAREAEFPEQVLHTVLREGSDVLHNY